jgi:light-regulated signal transduction histidine kinase (bacteriophytochrome)
MAKTTNELQKLNKVIRDLEQKNAELEHFVSHATHDIKEPLRSIAIGSEVLLRKYKDKLDAEAVQMLEFMLSSSKRFENIVASLKQFTKADAGKLHIETVDLNKLIEDVEKDLRILIKVTDAKIKVNQLPSIETDKAKLKMVLLQVVDNALKYKGGNQPDILIDCKESGNNVTVEIKDNGLGIAPEHHEKIMEPFARLHSKFEIEGVGLGLTLCQKILKRLEGTLKMKSAEGQGTTIQITLPKKFV